LREKSGCGTDLNIGHMNVREVFDARCAIAQTSGFISVNGRTLF
jgi:hypothetical protein